MDLKIECNVKVKIINNDKIISEDSKGIIEIIKKDDVEKHLISYGKDVVCTKKYKNNKLNKISLKVENENLIDVPQYGIYFILSAEQDKLLYIGKSQNLKKRLKEHLIKCNLSTNSKIENVYDYLIDRKNEGKPLSLKYCVLATQDVRMNATIEGALIDYVLENKNIDSFFDCCWNIRED